MLRSGMRALHLRNGLAHGIGHAEMGHIDDRPKHEMQADRYASLHLIHPAEYERVAVWTDDAALICQELQVTHRLLVAFQSRFAG